MTCIWFLLFYVIFLFGMPSIWEIETSFKESSIIYDREWNQLYTIYGWNENRQYIPYDQISIHTINALVAMEDQRFFSNIWFDIFGIARAGITCSLGGRCSGWSSLSQQLIKNTLLMNESLYRRKVQEIILSLQLNIRFSKEKILELYLNKISLWSNSYGVEQASRRFFGKPAKDINILESAVIASLPKTPTGYNPYSRRDRLMGYIYFHDTKWTEEGVVKVDSLSNPDVFNTFKTAISGIRFTTERGFSRVCGLAQFIWKNQFEKKLGTDCLTVAKKDLLEFFNSLQLSTKVVQENISSTVIVEYEVGRKDRVLMRMYEDGYISDAEYKDAFIQGLDYAFQDPKESIKYPHFVFYVKDYLVSLYGEDFFQQGWWKIYTTIDPKLQEKAEEIIDSYATSTFKSYGINNGSMVALDTHNRDVVAMVGSQDYFNKDIDGEVNIMTSLKQPGSSMKPLIYARAFEKNSLSTDTPIFDVEMNFGTYKPKNFDGEFLWPMTIRTALDASRNIPAIKMFYMATQWSANTGVEQEHDLVGYLQGLGLNSIEKREANNLYWPPIVLGSAEVRGIDFAASYAAFANNGQLIPPNPILKIFDPQWNEIKIDPPTPTQAVLPAAAYMITDILADNGARPAGWNNFLALTGGRKAAVKTGTSSKKIWESTLPRDLWTVGYTPQYTTVVWTGNTDWKPASARASGMESSALIWKKFMDFAHTDLPKQDFVKPSDVVGGSHFLYINGKKPDILKAFNPEKIQVDELCNGLVSDSTPHDAIRDAVILDRAFPIEDSYPSWREPVDAWLWSEKGRKYLIEKLWLTEDMMMVVAKPENICERPSESIPQFTTTLTDNSQLFAGLYPIEITFTSEHPMKEAQILINDKIYRGINLNNQKEGTVKAEFSLSASDGASQVVTVRVIDTFWYSTSRNYRVQLLSKDGTNPIIKTDNPATINIKSGQQVILSGTINDQSDVSKIQIFVNDVIYGTLQWVKKYNFTLKSPGDLAAGKHIISIQVTDFQKNVTTQVHTVNVQ
jgi:penicillin-binding protein 1A